MTIDTTSEVTNIKNHNMFQRRVGEGGGLLLSFSTLMKYGSSFSVGWHYFLYIKTTLCVLEVFPGKVVWWIVVNMCIVS
jgi:hypothetical protein